MFKFLVVLTTSSCLFSTVNSGDLIGVNGPSVAKEGEDVLLTCVVSGAFANKTVIWRKNNAILSAGMYTVTNDPRIKVLHDDDPDGPSEKGGNVWVLHIKQVKPTDSGSYICEVNTDPVLRSIRIVTVEQLNSQPANKSSSSPNTTTLEATSNDGFLVPPPLSYNDNNRSLWRSTVSPQLSHDFTECCERANVSSECIGFCNVHNILDGTTGIEPEACERDFPSIVKCMADGRNHVPCCVEKQVPDLCQDMCRGEYTPFTDLLKTRVSCVHHTLSGLQCILQGVQMIPSTPMDAYAEPLTETSVEVGWSLPLRLPQAVKFYSVNLTALHSFDDDPTEEDDAAASDAVNVATIDIRKMATTVTIRIVPANRTSIVVNDLRPLTMYAVTVTAQNEYGSSLPSNALRIFTHVNAGSGGAMTSASATVPDLPDIRTCCEQNGMTHRMCLDKMCDPRKTDLANLPDFMVCAPWSNITFTCLANRIDHTPCCKQRGIPDACFPLCSGKVTTLDFSLFKCLRFMSDYSSCLFQGYGVLAGPPSKLKSIVIASTFIILDWNKPKKLADSVTTYHVKYRRLGAGEDYTTIEKQYPPLILNGLLSNVYYECYVVSVNAYGKSDGSSRLIVLTKPQETVEDTPAKYNMTTCCQASGLLPQCRPLCSYDIRMSDMEKLGPVCQAQMAIIARCAAGGRDHTPCCNRRGVIPSCASLCRGVMPASSSNSPSISPDCLSYAGNILQCFEEGTENIPGPPEDVHTTAVTRTSINLSWLQPDFVAKDDNVTGGIELPSTVANISDIDFVVQYGRVNNMTMYETVAKLEIELTTNETSVELANLEPFSLYRILVMSRNKHGVSLPSSMLLINTTDQAAAAAADVNVTTYGAPSPPHSLAITAHSATWVQLSWQPPEFSHPHERISYRVHHKAMLGGKFEKTETRLLWMRLDDLKPSSQHILYVEAIGERATSLPSETLIAWTDPALPAFVDPPTVHPPDNIAVGGSMTILCLALGNPAPTISLYVGGHLVRQDTSRHMVTVIHNVTTDMEHVSCYADNGYGIPMQAIRKINICFPPRIQASGITVSQVGEQVELRCTVKARPPPKMIFWRDHDGRIPVIQGGNFDINIQNNESDPTVYAMRLRINKLKATDVGDYFCHAVNAFGTTTTPVSVRIRTTPALNRNVSECCDKQNVSMACREACSYYVDFDAIANKPECIVDFDKLMKCAADGSDHRACCADSNVPRKCLNWCRGEPVRSREICSIQYSRTIVGCFEENRDRLPGPPENIAVNVVADNEVTISWDPPSKNPNAVEGYRIFYHEAVPSGATTNSESSAETADAANNSIAANFTEVRRLDVKETTVSIEGLKRDVLYELVVKAGNNFGASVLTDPVKFTLGDHQMTSASYSNTVGTVSGILASMLAILLAAAAIIFYRKHRSHEKAANGVAFENPTYTRGLEHVQLPTVTMHSGSTMSPPSPIKGDESGVPQSTAIGADGPMTAATEVNPSIYEELKLGHEGAGFRKLVS